MPPKNNGQKEYVTFYLFKATIESLRKLAKGKYPDTQWGISWEAEEAIRSWLRNTHTQEQLLPIKVNPSLPHVHFIMEQIIQALKEAGCLIQCDTQDLRRAISKVRGNDDRTVKKWTKILLDEKKLKILHPSVFEIV